MNRGRAAAERGKGNEPIEMTDRAGGHKLRQNTENGAVSTSPETMKPSTAQGLLSAGKPAPEPAIELEISVSFVRVVRGRSDLAEP
jgi:hypothetical protein